MVRAGVGGTVMERAVAGTAGDAVDVYRPSPPVRIPSGRLRLGTGVPAGRAFQWPLFAQPTIRAFHFPILAVSRCYDPAVVNHICRVLDRTFAAIGIGHPAASLHHRSALRPITPTMPVTPPGQKLPSCIMSSAHRGTAVQPKVLQHNGFDTYIFMVWGRTIRRPIRTPRYPAIRAVCRHSSTKSVPDRRPAWTSS